MNGTCKLTGEHGKFVKSHILPRAFFEASKDSRAEPFEILSSRADVRQKKNRIGLYDAALVTAAGEKHLAELDDYAIKLLMPRPTRDQLFKNEQGFIARQDGDALAYQVKNFDYARLKLFFISLLWRISASSRPELANIGLRAEEQLREMILRRDPGTPEEFSVFIYRYTDLASKPAFLPFRNKLEGVDFVKMVCGSFGFNIKPAMSLPQKVWLKYKFFQTSLLRF